MRMLTILALSLPLALGAAVWASVKGQNGLEPRAFKPPRLAVVDIADVFDNYQKKKDVEVVGKRTGTTQVVLRREKAKLAQLEDLANKQADELKQEISAKADEKEVGALTQDVSSTRSDLDSTKKTLDATRSDLGMARSEFGTLIARNHDQIEELRKLGERDYFEFSLTRNKIQKVAGIGLTLKGTNVKHHQYNLILNADDMNILKKNRTVNEPIFFYTAGSKRPFELTVNNVQSGQAKGYISTPKGATSEVASRGEGVR